MSIEVGYKPSNTAQAMVKKLDAKGLAPLSRAIQRMREASATVEAELLVAFTRRGTARG